MSETHLTFKTMKLVTLCTKLVYKEVSDTPWSVDGASEAETRSALTSYIQVATVTSWVGICGMPCSEPAAPQ